ncbi:hypothetical protein [Burkholderia cenocepacia]|uniref:hypothetical protein n=1 Tax=Burkholderia cenocepacia TaxID=95486 RepID=UPI001B8E1151|nr:hypothetical protein [Burkholderia cenocepacia]MBR8137213.1 hypothetical protein [Burkholderia cenocepacia]
MQLMDIAKQAGFDIAGVGTDRVIGSAIALANFAALVRNEPAPIPLGWHFERCSVRVMVAHYFDEQGRALCRRKDFDASLLPAGDTTQMRCIECERRLDDRKRAARERERLEDSKGEYAVAARRGPINEGPMRGYDAGVSSFRSLCETSRGRG